MSFLKNGEKGFIDEDAHIGGDYKRARISTPEFTPEYIEKII